MKIKILIILSFSFFFELSAIPESIFEIEQIQELHAVLEKEGTLFFTGFIREKDLFSPSIPSKWHVENISKPEGMDVGKVARSFGGLMVDKLIAEAEIIQNLPPDNALYEKALILFDLSDWFGNTVGYGNIFLAQRCLDLAAVATTRLVADVKFPVEKCEELGGRFDPPWMDVSFRIQILNNEAGTQIFENYTHDKLVASWERGRWLSYGTNATRNLDWLKEELGEQQVDVMLKNILFFKDVKFRSDYDSKLKNHWEKKWHGRIAGGLGVQSVRKGKALFKFRTEIGFFPEKLILKEKSVDELRLEELHKRRGVKIVPSSLHGSEQEAAFAQVWRKHAKEKMKISEPGYQQYSTVYGSAWQAYDEVGRGMFFDHDSQLIYNEKQGLKLMREMQKKSTE